MKLSIIIPAYNEAKRIKDCLQSVFAALRADARVNLTAEVIVVDNNSSDDTTCLARAAGAQVIFEPVNQIARARNAGAARATGEWLVFLDADTLLPPETLADMLKEIERGNIAGGGGVLNFGKVGLVERGFVGVCNAAIRAFKMTAGCFIFCRSDLFREAGGFDQEYFAGEDAEFGKALKRVARARGMRLAILTRHPPLTSDRKFRLYGLRKILLAVGRYAFLPKSTMRDKRYLDIFYDGKR